MFRRRGSTNGIDDSLLVLPSRNDGPVMKPRPRSSPFSSLVVVGCLLLCLWAFTTGHLIWSGSPQWGSSSSQGGTAAVHLPTSDKRRLSDGSWAPTLLIYVFSNTDPEYLNNLRFFVQFGMSPDDGVTYLIVVQEQEGQAVGVDAAPRACSQLASLCLCHQAWNNIV